MARASTPLNLSLPVERRLGLTGPRDSRAGPGHALASPRGSRSGRHVGRNWGPRHTGPNRNARSPLVPCLLPQPPTRSASCSLTPCPPAPALPSLRPSWRSTHDRRRPRKGSGRPRAAAHLDFAAGSPSLSMPRAHWLLSPEPIGSSAPNPIRFASSLTPDPPTSHSPASLCGDTTTPETQRD